jgi:hypothetical protein
MYFTLHAVNRNPLMREEVLYKSEVKTCLKIRKFIQKRCGREIKQAPTAWG